MSKFGLGRGLDALITKKRDSLPSSPPVRMPRVSDDRGEGDNREIPVVSIRLNRYQPRAHFDDEKIDELAQSIREYGIIQPLVVSREDGEYHLIAGERRLRAAKIAGLLKVPVVIRSANEHERLSLAIIENLQRVDLNPIELARSYKSLSEEFNLTHDEIAKKVSKSRPVISNTLRLLSLPDEIKSALSRGTITEAHARILMGIEDEAQQKQFFQKIVREKLTVPEARDAFRTRRSRTSARASSHSSSFHAQEELLREQLGTKVQIKKRAKGGVIEIEFYSPEDLRQLLRKMITDLDG